jgi:two-component system LytT family response regulator
MAEPLRILVADDEPLALERLLFAFRDIPDAEVIGTATNGIEAGEKIAELRPDVAILDIQMPGRTGLGVAALVPADERPEIIFLTAFDQHAIDAFEVEAADYILKPLRLDRLRQAIERVRRRRLHKPQELVADAVSANDEDCFWVQERSGMVRVAWADIDWIEAAKDYVLLHTASRSHILRATMTAIEERVDPAMLVRVHRSNFVRPGAVRAIQHSPSGAAVLVLNDGVAVPVGPSYTPDVRRRFESLFS